MRPIPYVCPVCPESMVETEDGSARGYYGVLVKDGKPMVGNGTVRSLTCPNDETPLIPTGVVRAVNTKVMSDVTHEMSLSKVS